MANILYICPQPDLHRQPMCLKVAEAMLSCSHRVRLLTTFTPENEEVVYPRNLEFLMPFKNWSLLELPKLALSCQNFSPDVIHFFYDQDCDHSRRLLNMIAPSFFKSVFGSRLVFHILGTLQEKSFVFSQWVHQSDMVITSDHFQLLKTSSLFESPRSQIHLALGQYTPEDSSSPQLDWISSRFSRFIYVSGSVRSSNEAITIFKMIEHELKDSSDLGVVVNIELMRGGLFAETEVSAFLQDNFLESKVILLRNVDARQDSILTRICSGYFMCHLGLEPESISLALDSFIRRDQLVYCTPQQAHFVKGSIRAPIRLKECELSKPILEEISPIYEAGGTSDYLDDVSVDPMNSMNRAYSKILNL